LIRYTVDGREYEKWAYDSFEYYTAWRWPKERMLERFTVGEMYPCWHDPEDPSQVVVVRGYSFLTYVFAALFVATAGLTAWGAVRRFAGVAPEPVAESTPAPVRVPTDSGQPSKGGPWVSPSVWVLWSMFIGGAIGSWGYDPETAPEFFDGVLSQFVRFATVGAICVGVQVLLMPIIFRINEGRFDWRRALTGAAQWTLCWTVFGVIAFAGLGIYRYIGAVSGGWEGGVLATVVGGVIGAAFSVCMTYVAARLTMVEHSGSPQRSG
jgi:hypothetical protein